MSDLADRLAKHPLNSYRHMSHEELAAGIKQMLADLDTLAMRDGCIAAAWAVEVIPHLLFKFEDAEAGFMVLEDTIDLMQKREVAP